MRQNYGYDVFELLAIFGEKLIQYRDKFDDDEIDDFVEFFDGLLIHDSYPGKELKDKLVAKFKNVKKSAVVFSEQFPKTTFDIKSPELYINGITKSRFYSNLPLFLNKFRDEGKIQLDILSLGIGYNLKKANYIRDKLMTKALANHKSFDFNNVIKFPESDDRGSDDRKNNEFKHWEELFFLANQEQREDDFFEFDDDIRENQKFSIFDLEVLLNDLVNKVSDE